MVFFTTTFLRSWAFLSSQLATSSPQKTVLKEMDIQFHFKLCHFPGSLSESREVALRAEYCPLGVGIKPSSRAMVSNFREAAVAGL